MTITSKRIAMIDSCEDGDIFWKISIKPLIIIICCHYCNLSKIYFLFVAVESLLDEQTCK